MKTKRQKGKEKTFYHTPSHTKDILTAKVKPGDYSVLYANIEKGFRSDYYLYYPKKDYERDIDYIIELEEEYKYYPFYSKIVIELDGIKMVQFSIDSSG